MRPPKPSTLLVIGYGNSLRSDDGVGPRVAEAIAELHLPNVETLICPQLTPELAEPVSRAGRALFVDAAVDRPRQVQLRRTLPADSGQIMAHAADPNIILALARDVFGNAPEAWWLTIPIEQLGIGEELSPLAREGCADAIGRVKELSTTWVK
jgi:hydrogenase maturation protease